MAIKVQNTTVIDDSRNIVNAETINGIAIGVKKPSIISPTDGSQEIGSSITFQSSPFRTSIGTDTHASSDWELATDSGFTNIVASSIDDTTNLTSITFSGLSVDTYFVRVRHSGATLGDSGFSDTVSFSLIEQILYGWGDYPLHGTQFTVTVNSPALVVGGFTSWSLVDASRERTLGILSTGDLYAWGNNGNGALGDGTTVNQPTPVTVTGNITNWSFASTSTNHSQAVTKDGLAYGWGFNEEYALGLGTNSPANVTSPTLLAGNINDWIEIYAGNNFGLGLRETGELYGWGDNRNGAVGNGSTSSFISSPESVLGNITDWDKLSANPEEPSTLAIRSNGELYGWGKNDFGILGTNDGSSEKTSPVITGVGFTDWVDVSTAGGHTLAIRSNGLLYSWGRNYEGALGQGSFGGTNSSPNTVVGGITDWINTSASAENTRESSHAVRSNGQLYSWGSNEQGTLGIGTSDSTLSKNSPVLVVGGITDWVDVEGGGFQAFAIST